MEKQIVIRNIHKIDLMDLEALNKHRVAISTSTLSAKAKELLYKACDKKEELLLSTADALAQNGDISDIIQGEL